jgi:glycosyltransferase involved in cell wall biosynthesis
MKLSAVIIARDEEKNIVECLRNAAFCDERLVVDSGSSDGTVRLAEAEGAKVWRRDFDDFSSQKNFAISKATGDWLLLLDADERVSPALQREILAALGSTEMDGYYVPRRNNLFGRWMDHGPHRGDLQLRLVRRGKASFKGSVHERVVVGGAVGTLKAPLLHFSTQTVDAYRKKLELYTSLEAKMLREQGTRVSLLELWVRPLAVFFKQTLLQAGFLDGREGLLFSWLSARYEFVRLAKARERKNAV